MPHLAEKNRIFGIRKWKQAGPGMASSGGQPFRRPVSAVPVSCFRSPPEPSAGRFPAVRPGCADALRMRLFVPDGPFGRISVRKGHLADGTERSRVCAVHGSGVRLQPRARKLEWGRVVPPRVPDDSGAVAGPCAAIWKHIVTDDESASRMELRRRSLRDERAPAYARRNAPGRRRETRLSARHGRRCRMAHADLPDRGA